MGEIYHVYNRGVEKRPIFKLRKDYLRFLDLITYYRFASCPLRFSYFRRLPEEEKENIFKKLETESKSLVEIFTFCLMPNHFHFQFKQLVNGGISKFIAKITNAYSHYFNVRHKRVGHLFQGNFQAVRIETDEQFLHVNRYIHLNPITSYLIEFKDLPNYEYSSYPEYSGAKGGFCNTRQALSHFKSLEAYKMFIEDQVDYARRLDAIKHLLLE